MGFGRFLSGRIGEAANRVVPDLGVFVIQRLGQCSEMLRDNSLYLNKSRVYKVRDKAALAYL
jgi:hypothetical protein